jgi:ubiquinol-cytochrome c reductase cytochrome b subunit
MATIFNLDHRPRLVHWHFFDMSVANVVVAVALLLVFALAVVLRGPMRTGSWLDVFGVATIAALIVAAASGLALALRGPSWWHLSSVGRFFNSIHLWAVELFFLFVVVHLWAKFWEAAWREGRAIVWITGAVGFLAATPVALTGYLSQKNLDAQWLATASKDGLNAIGANEFFNVTNFGQMYSYHVLILPVIVSVLVVGHVLLVRRHGLAPPLELRLTRRHADSSPPAEAFPTPASESAKQGANR